ncbi:hypothetical protein [Halopiger xanaduensis]|nr:hypothetical protein [Halopiger xanaduensis]
MATTQTATTADAPTLPTDWTDAWPALERDDHDPQPLATNDPTPTTQRTLADYGGSDVVEPDRPSFPVDDRDHTEQASVFCYPTEWWDDADRLETLYHDRDLDIREISDLFGDDRGYEAVRSKLNETGVRDPDAEKTGADLLASLDPEDAGLSPMLEDDDADTRRRFA